MSETTSTEDEADRPAGAQDPGAEASEGTAEPHAPQAGDEAPGEGADAEGEPDPVAALTAERDELRERLMRALAEVENIRKRAERDRRDAEAYGGTRLARDVLAVYDNLGRALDTVDEEMRRAAGPLIEGVELTQRDLLNAFAKHKIETVTPELGEKFDPKLHQAMFEAPAPGAEAGTIIQVMQTGFTIAGRLLRPAMVGVAAAQPADAPAQN